MANEHLFLPKLAAVTFDAAQGDPNASLGGFRSITSIAEVESTFTSVTSDRIVIDTTLPAGDFTGYWMVALETNLNQAREIVTYVEGSNTMTLDFDFDSTPLSGDRYWLFAPNGFFDSFDVSDCRSRDPRHRLTYIYNSTGGQLDDIRVYVKDIQSGPVHCDVAMAVHTFGQNEHFDVDDISDENDPPVLFNTDTGIWGPAQDFVRKRDFDAADVGSPFGTGTASGEKSIRDSGTSVNADRPIWVRLSFDPDDPIPLPSRVVFQVFIDSEDGTTVSSFMVIADVDGVPEQVIPLVDRRLRIAGGARLSCIVTDSIAPFEPVPGRTIRIEKTAGPGTLNPQAKSVQEAAIPAADGEPIRRVYVSPTDPGDVGMTVTFSFEVT